jgi:hypothetical protein
VFQAIGVKTEEKSAKNRGEFAPKKASKRLIFLHDFNQHFPEPAKNFVKITVMHRLKPHKIQGF